jgi:hypothetical protein
LRQLLAASFGVSAATTSFNFSGNTSPGGPINFMSADGILSLTATATRQDNSGNPIAGNAFLGQYSGGLGVCSGSVSNSGSCSEDHQVDSRGPEEAVLFDFGAQDVTLERVTFSYIGNNDDFSFSFFTDDNTNPGTFYRDIRLPNNGSIQTYIFSGTYLGSLFGIGAAGISDWNDEFKIRNIGVSYDVAAVPVPAAAFLFAPALLGFICLRRKTKVA